MNSTLQPRHQAKTQTLPGHPNRILRSALIAIVTPLIGTHLAAQSTATAPAGYVSAAPIYTPASFMKQLHQQWSAPLAKSLAQQTQTMPSTLQALCNATPANAASALRKARAQWGQSVASWQSLSAVALGPIVERRLLRQIDFAPPRPELIARAVKHAPTSARDMERIGTPAKGFPALEWLLWAQPVKPGSAECRYTEQVALDLDRETQQLARDFTAIAAQNWDNNDEEVATITSANQAFSELINQWVGGMERLRWAQMERPVREADHKGRSTTQFPRLASGETVNNWAASWQTLRNVAIAPNSQRFSDKPSNSLASLESYLRGLGQNQLADTLRHTALRVDVLMQNLTPANSNKILAAAKAMTVLQRLLESKIAPALQIRIGFSDADGD